MSVSKVFTLVLGMAPWALPQSAVLECIADTWVSPKSVAAGAGSGRVLELEGADRLILLNFRLSAIEGWRVTRATLLLHRSGDGAPGRMGVSTISTRWSESEAAFPSPRTGMAWAGPASDLRDVIFSRGNSRYSFFQSQDYGGGWLRADVDPALIEWLLAGKGFGLVLLGLDNRPRRFDSRETVQYSPYLLVEGRAR